MVIWDNKRPHPSDRPRHRMDQRKTMSHLIPEVMLKNDEDTAKGQGKPAVADQIWDDFSTKVSTGNKLKQWINRTLWVHIDINKWINSKFDEEQHIYMVSKQFPTGHLLITVISFLGCGNKIPHIRWLKTTEVYYLIILEVRSGSCPLWDWAGSFCASSQLVVMAINPWLSLACSCITTIFVPVVTWCSPCVYVSEFPSSREDASYNGTKPAGTT